MLCGERGCGEHRADTNSHHAVDLAPSNTNFEGKIKCIFKECEFYISGVVSTDPFCGSRAALLPRPSVMGCSRTRTRLYLDLRTQGVKSPLQ